MPWTVNSEIFPLWARSTGNACSAGVNWIFNVLVSLTFLHVAEFLTYYGKTHLTSNIGNHKPAVTVTMNVSSRCILHVHQPRGPGSRFFVRLPPRDKGPTAGGHREPVHGSTVLLWSIITHRESPCPLHQGNRKQLPPL